MSTEVFTSARVVDKADTDTSAVTYICMHAELNSVHMVIVEHI